MWYHFQYYKERVKNWDVCWDLVQKTLHAGGDVVVHCRSGVHRAPLLTQQFFCWGLKIAHEDSRAIIEDRRYVEFDTVIAGHGRVDNRKWLAEWESRGLKAPCLLEQREPEPPRIARLRKHRPDSWRNWNRDSQASASSSGATLEGALPLSNEESFPRLVPASHQEPA